MIEASAISPRGDGAYQQRVRGQRSRSRSMATGKALPVMATPLSFTGQLNTVISFFAPSVVSRV